MITVNNLSKSYGNRNALSQINVTLETGTMTFLTGHSGAGKSTLLRLLSLADDFSEGDILLNGESLKQMRKSQIPYLRRKMGLIFQSPNLLNDRTVFDNVSLPLLISGVAHNEVARRTRAALDMVGLLSKEKNRPQELSTGQQQRIGIARAVVHKPSIILADEPTGNLDPALSKDIMSLFSTLNEFGVTVLIATHDLSLIATMRYPILILKEGRLAC